MLVLVPVTTKLTVEERGALQREAARIGDTPSGVLRLYVAGLLAPTEAAPKRSARGAAPQERTREKRGPTDLTAASPDRDEPAPPPTAAVAEPPAASSASPAPRPAGRRRPDVARQPRAPKVLPEAPTEAPRAPEPAGPRCESASDGQHRLRSLDGGATPAEQKAVAAGFSEVCAYCGDLFTPEELRGLPQVTDRDPDCGGGRHRWEPLPPRRQRASGNRVYCTRCGREGA